MDKTSNIFINGTCPWCKSKDINTAWVDNFISDYWCSNCNLFEHYRAGVPKWFNEIYYICFKNNMKEKYSFAEFQKLLKLKEFL